MGKTHNFVCLPIGSLDHNRVQVYFEMYKCIMIFYFIIDPNFNETELLKKNSGRLSKLSNDLETGECFQ